jgi:methylmalonyl-CoA/ethylmalonyl-CoA epimerase
MTHNRPTHIEHIGIAVKDLDLAIPLYEKLLGTPCYAVEEVADQKVRTAFFRLGETKIELLASTAADGPIASFIEKRGEGLHHIAYAVEGLPSLLKALSAEVTRLIDNEPRKGAEDMRIAFLHPRSTLGVLTELCEKA